MVEGLVSNSSLEWLDVSPNRFRPSASQPLGDSCSRNTGLEELVFGLNGIGDVGAGFFAAALRMNTVLTCLNLKSNGIQVEGARLLADGLSLNTGLTTLDVSQNSLGVFGAQAIAK